MRCPVDGTTPVLAGRAGVGIDYCPQCRGVWLDRGELDHILEHTTDGYEGEHYRDHRNRRRDDDVEYRGGRYEQPSPKRAERSRR
jgi:uncharacterized protein